MWPMRFIRFRENDRTASLQVDIVTWESLLRNKWNRGFQGGMSSWWLLHVPSGCTHQNYIQITGIWSARSSTSRGRRIEQSWKASIESSRVRFVNRPRNSEDNRSIHVRDTHPSGSGGQFKRLRLHLASQSEEALKPGQTCYRVLRCSLHSTMTWTPTPMWTLPLMIDG